jgi:hypothetical protein
VSVPRRIWLNRWPVLRGVLPVRRSEVAGDVLAGVTLAALGIPQALGYAKIAGMPVVSGLYTLILPMAVFAVLGSSRRLVVAADSATAAILAAALISLATPGSVRYVHLAGLAALLAGGLLLLARLARLGFLAGFLSRTVLLGFLTGVGIRVAAEQLPDMLGVTATGTRTLGRLVSTAAAVPHAHPETVAVSVAVILVMLVARRIIRRLPGALIAVIAAIIVGRAADLARHGVAVIGPVPRGLPPLGLPALSLHDATALLGAAASMFVVIPAQSAATSRVYAAMVRNPEARSGQGRAGDSAEGDHYGGADDRQLRLQPVSAGDDLCAVRRLVQPPLAAFFPLEVLDSVREVSCFAVYAAVGQRLVEQPACRADEWPALLVLHVAWLLTDEGQRGALRAGTEDNCRWPGGRGRIACRQRLPLRAFGASSQIHSPYRRCRSGPPTARRPPCATADPAGRGET